MAAGVHTPLALAQLTKKGERGVPLPCVCVYKTEVLWAFHVEFHTNRAAFLFLPDGGIDARTPRNFLMRDDKKVLSFLALQESSINPIRYDSSLMSTDLRKQKLAKKYISAGSASIFSCFFLIRFQNFCNFGTFLSSCWSLDCRYHRKRWVNQRFYCRFSITRKRLHYLMIINNPITHYAPTEKQKINILLVEGTST